VAQAAILPENKNLLRDGKFPWRLAKYASLEPFSWVPSYLFLYLIFLATSYTLQKGVHIRVTFILDLFKFKMKRFLELVASLFAVIICFVLLWQTSLLTRGAFKDDWTAPTMLSVRY